MCTTNDWGNLSHKAKQQSCENEQLIILSIMLHFNGML